MNQEVLRMERSVRDRNSTDKVLMNYWLYFFILSWLTLGIMGWVLFFQRIERLDKYIKRRSEYFEALINYCDAIAREKGSDESLLIRISSLRKVYESDFLGKNKEINAGLSLFLSIITFGIWGLVVMYKLNKAWNNIQISEQRVYEELNPILMKLELIKYPATIRLNTGKSRSFILYLFLSVITFGIWAIVWDYKIHTDADDLYPEFHTAEDLILSALR